MSDETPTHEAPLPEDTTALNILKEQVTHLTAELRTLTSERDEARGSLSEVITERDTLQAQIASPDAMAQELAQLKSQIRDRAHKDVFTKLAKDAKAKEAAIDHLWKVSGYTSEDETPDEKALGKILADLKVNADYCFDATEPPNMAAAREAARVTSRTKYGLEIRDEVITPGGGRSERNKGGDGTIITAEMRNDPKFMLDPSNREMISLAAKEHRFR